MVEELQAAAATIEELRTQRVMQDATAQTNTMEHRRALEDATAQTTDFLHVAPAILDFRPYGTPCLLSLH